MVDTPELRRSAAGRFSEFNAAAVDINHDVKRLHESISKCRRVLCASVLNGEAILAAPALYKYVSSAPA